MSINRGQDKDMAHIYSGVLLSRNKNEIMPFAALWMDLDIVILREVSHRKTNIMCYHLNVKSKKGEVQMNLFTEVEPLM